MSAMTARALLDRYHAAFVAGDLTALGECFAYPVHAIATTSRGVSIASMSRDEWSDALRGVLGAYSRLGVADSGVSGLAEQEVIPGVTQLRVHWGLRRADGTAIYDFLAAYTITGSDAAARIVSVTHDEGPKLRRALEQLGPR